MIWKTGRWRGVERIRTTFMLRLKIALLVLTSLAPAQTKPPTYGRAEYYRAPQLGVMIGFIKDPQHRNYTIDEWRKGLGKNFDARALVGRIKASGAAHIIWYDKWIDGLVFRKTKTTSYHTDRDFLAELMPECKRQHIRLLAYFNAFYDGNPEFAQWACVDRRGNRIVYPPPWPANALSMYSPYREKLLEQVRELFQNYGIDGLWLDGATYPPYANDPWTRQAFQKQTGKSIDDASVDELRRFASDSVTSWYREIADLVHKLNPAAVITTNNFIEPLVSGPRSGPRNIINIAERLDFFSAEMQHLLARQFRSAEYYGTFEKPFEALSMLSDIWFSPLGSGPPQTSKKPVGMSLELATVLSGGMNIYLSIALGYDGTVDEPTFELVDQSGRWLRSRQPWLEGAQGIYDTGVVLGTADSGDLDWPGGKGDYNMAMFPLEANLRLNGYLPRRFINCRNAVHWDQIPKSVRTLIVPDRVSFSPEDALKVERFVRDGGRVVAFGRGIGLSKSGESLKAAAIFGVRAGGQATIRNCTMTWGQERTKLATPVWYLRSAGSDVVLWAGAHDVGAVPVMTRNRVGAGTAYAVAFPESTILDQPKFLEFLWKEVIGESFYHVDDTSGRYTVRLRRQNQRHILHVLDNIESPSAIDGVGRYCAAYVKLSINADLLPFQKAFVEPGEQALPVTSTSHWKTVEVYLAPELTIRLE